MRYESYATNCIQIQKSVHALIMFVRITQILFTRRPNKYEQRCSAARKWVKCGDRCEISSNVQRRRRKDRDTLKCWSQQRSEVEMVGWQERLLGEDRQKERVLGEEWRRQTFIRDTSTKDTNTKYTNTKETNRQIQNTA